MVEINLNCGRRVMKQKIVLIIFLLLIGASTFGHSGRTDRNGGHYNRKTGNYHYHNGGDKGNSGMGWVALSGGIGLILFLKSAGNKKH